MFISVFLLGIVVSPPDDKFKSHIVNNFYRQYKSFRIALRSKVEVMSRRFMPRRHRAASPSSMAARGHADSALTPGPHALTAAAGE